MTRLTDLTLNTDDTIVAIWATRGRKYWFALIAGADGRHRMQGDGCGASYLASVTRSDAIGDIESRIHAAKVIDGINYAPVGFIGEPTS